MRPSKPPPGPDELRRIRLVRSLSRRLDLPMAVLSVLFFGLTIAELTLAHDSPHRSWIDRAILGLWAVFGLEFLVKFAIAPRKAAYLKGRWFDVLVLIVPMFRVLRVVRAFRAGYSLLKLGLAVRRGTRALARFRHASRLDYVTGLTGLVVVAGAAAMFLLERDAAGSQIRTFPDAVWWSAAIVTTVASELNPVTPWGRVLAVFMMVYGMAVFGYFVTQAVTFIQRSPD